MADRHPRPPARGDEAELFRAFNDELLQSVAQSSWTTTHDVIEDACAFAWAQFIEHQPDRNRNWRGWLFRTAQRETWRLAREMGDSIPIRDVEYELGAWAPVDPHDRYALRDGVEDAFSVLARLPPRLQRIAMLRALGLRHTEIGEITGDSPRRVGQLISRANVLIQDVLDERSHQAEPGSPRAERLWELEHEQPSWLTAQIGRVPRSGRRWKFQTLQRRAWRRAALALDDYRTAIGPRRFNEAAEVPPADPGLRRQYELARGAVEALAHARGGAIGRGLGD
jgi:DNA-directed RNA polymerase specialized sigma24 family protein